MFVPRQSDWRGKIVPKTQTIDTCMHYLRQDEKIDENTGLDRLVMIGMVFSGELVRHCVARRHPPN